MHLNASALFSEVGLYQELTFQKPHRLITSKSYPLQVRQYDDPYQLALNFCVKHGLNQMAVQVVEKRIQKILGKDKVRRNSNSALKGSVINRNSSFKKDQVQTTIKRTPTNKSSNNLITNSPLYQKGMKSINKAKQTRRKAKMQKEAQEQRQMTFKPKINEVSEKIVEVRRMIGGNIRKPKKMKIDQLQQQMKQCTFKPNINKQQQFIKFRSSKIVQERFIRSEEQNIQRLYNDSDFKKRREQKLNKQKQKYSYHPTINHKSKVQIRDTFMERLEKDIRNKKQRQLKVVNENEGYSFTPEIGRPPKIERNKQNLPIGQYLMNSESKSRHLRSTSQIKQDTSSVPFGEVVMFGKNSGVIYNNLIKQRLQSLFQILDGNGDGLISPQFIDIDGLSSNTLLLMKPFFKQMEEMNAVLDQRGFIKAMIKLLEVAPQVLKAQFITQRWKKDQDPKFSFRPTLNNKSHRLAQNRSALDLYEQGIKTKKKKQVYTALLQAKKQQQELDNCTFKPLLNSVSHVYFKKYLMRQENGNQTSPRYIGSSRNQQI